MLFVIAGAAQGKGPMGYAFKLLSTIAENKSALTAEKRKQYARDLRAFNKGESDSPPAEVAEALIFAESQSTYAGLVKVLSASSEGMLMGDAEADAISKALESPHGGHNALIRKAYHHERHGKNTSGEGTLSVDEPRLAICTSGTDAQFLPLIDSVENGLFSRFGVYRFTAPDVLENRMKRRKENDSKDAYLSSATETVTKLYETLEGRGSLLYVDVDEEQWTEYVYMPLLRLFNRLYGGEIKAHRAFSANVKRAVVLAARITSILTIYGLAEKGADLSSNCKSAEASESSMKVAGMLALIYTENSIRQALSLKPGLGTLPEMDTTGRMTADQRTFLSALPHAFTTADAESKGWGKSAVVNANRATVFRWLSAWIDEGVLLKRGRGRYEKAPTRATYATTATFSPDALESSDNGETLRATNDATNSEPEKVASEVAQKVARENGQPELETGKVAQVAIVARSGFSENHEDDFPTGDVLPGGDLLQFDVSDEGEEVDHV